jgi:putative protease
MKDLALPDHVPALRAAGVSCFKVEGRKKSPLYVATTTDYYRRLIDGRLEAGERPTLEADMQTVFSRPRTRLFVQSHKDKEVADRDTVGHRGTLIGQVETVLGEGTAEPRLRFRTRRALQRHDGLQVDLPTLGKPFGFAVEHLWLITTGRKGKRQEVFEAPADSLVEASLPREHPELPAGAPVYCSSSQTVKQKYRHDRPKPGLFRNRKGVAVEVTLTPNDLTAVGRVRPRRPQDRAVEVRRTLSGPFPAARDRQVMEDAVRSTFEKLGQTQLELVSLEFHNGENCFVPVSRLNQLRRELTAPLEQALRAQEAARIQRLQIELSPQEKGVRSPCHPVTLSPCQAFRWSIKVDRIGFLDALEEADLAHVDEILVDITRDHPTLLVQKLEQWAGRIGRERLRLALPPLTRSWEDKGLRQKIRHFREAGWTRWEAANLSAWSYLDLDPTDPTTGTLDLSTDWSVYVLNHLAARQLLRMGVRRFALSPEDGLANVRSLLAEFGERGVVIVHQDTPQFLAESCAYANLIGGCPGKANCKFESMEMVSSYGEKVTALDYHCRTIVLNQGPFCLSTRLDDLAKAGAQCLRADFIYRPYDPLEVRQRWRLVRAGRAVPLGHAANFDRGIQ